MLLTAPEIFEVVLAVEVTMVTSPSMHNPRLHFIGTRPLDFCIQGIRTLSLNRVFVGLVRRPSFGMKAHLDVCLDNELRVALLCHVQEVAAVHVHKPLSLITLILIF
jgi:hypothetical protein